MQDTPNDISDELSSFLMPLDFFYSKNKSKLPKVFPVQDSNIPQTESKLLAHQSDMTSTLTNHHGSDLFIEVLDNELNEHYLLRMVVLKKLDDSKPVEFGAIGIDPQGLALIIAIDRPLDMLRTVVNVTGDATVASVVASTEGEKIKFKKDE